MNLILSGVLIAACLGVVCARPDGSFYGPPIQEPLIQKHIYVHVPPPDPEYHAVPPKVIAPPPAKKHYKIVFIKAPTYAPPRAPVIPEMQNNEEKTLIYVLHKNPQDADPIIIPTPKPTQPSRPEVYFIRYKTQKEVGYSGGPDTHYLPSSTAATYVTTAKPSYHISTLRPTLHRSTINILPRSPTPKNITPSPTPHSLD